MAAKPTGKPAAKPKALVSVAPNSLAPTSDAVQMAPAGESPVVTPALKLRNLVERVVAVSGGNKKGVKEIVEATLTQLGASLAKGEELNLPGLGKVRVARTSDRDGRTVMTLKVRGAGPAKPKQTLADVDEDV